MIEFLVCYDYGQGGIWLYVKAESAKALRKAYLSLTVFESPPSFWNEQLEVLARKADPVKDPKWREWLASLNKSN